MLRVSRTMMMRSSRGLLEKAAEFSSHSKAGVPGQDTSVKGKIKTEMKKAIKINLVLFPIIVFVCVYFFPVPTAEQERQMIMEYEKNAGWKT